MTERNAHALIDLPGARRRKILVVDDEPSLSSLIEDWLSDFFEVLVSFNARAAIQKAVWQKPDLILMDMVLPDMTGFEAVRFLQADAQTRAIPIIVMTSKSFDDSTIQMIKSEPNVRGFLNKPFRPTDLMKMVESVVKGQRPILDVKAPSASPPAPMPKGLPAGLTTPPSAYPTVPAPAPSARARPEPPPTPVRPQPLPPREMPPSGAPAMPRGGPPRSPEPPPMRRPPPAPPITPPPPERPRASDTASVRATVDASATPPPRVAMAGTAVERGGGASPMRRGFWALLGVVLIAAVAVVLAEWTARSMRSGLGRDFFFPPLRASPDAAFPYAWDEGSAWREGEITYRINSWGLRGGDFPVVAPDGVLRVFLLGGGLVFGEGMKEEETVSRLLEDRLNARVPAGGRVQVINGGLWGFSPEEQWAYYMKNGLQFRPTVLIWVLENKPGGTPSASGLRRLASLSDPGWLGRTQLFRLWKAHLLRMNPDAPSTFASLRAGPAAVAANYPTWVRCVVLPPEPSSTPDPLLLRMGEDYQRMTSVESSAGMAQLLARWIDEAMRGGAAPLEPL